MKYRKKPVIIEAIQFTPELALASLQNYLPIPGTDLYVSGSRNRGKLIDAWVYIKTLEGEMRCDLGDWIITGIKGEQYPCKPDVFAATYEPVEDECKSH